MKKKIAIVGNGGFAKEVEWMIKRINEKNNEWDILGFIGEEKSEEKNIVATDEEIIHYKDELNIVIAIGNPCVRQKVYDKYKKNENILFPNLIAPSVLISDSTKIGKGNIVCEGSIMTTDICMNDFNIVNLNCTIGHEVLIGNYVTINPGSNISGNVTICDNVEVGTGTKIIQGVTIGEKTIIGAGAVVNRNIPDRCTAVGVPAKVIKKW